jgi:glutathione S-transferase
VATSIGGLGQGRKGGLGLPDSKGIIMPTLYGAYRSRATRNFWLAGELGITLDYVPVWQAYRTTAAGVGMTTQSPEFLAISPAGAIPVLQDGDLVLSESLAINLYLARKYGGPLAAENAAEDAQMLQWALYGVTALEPAALPLMFAFNEGRGADPEVAVHVAALHRPLMALENHLAAHGQMVGGRFTVADINMAEILRYAQGHPTLLAGFPAVDKWIRACQARPAFQAMWAKRLAEPI